MRNRSRKLIFNLKVDDTLTFFERLNTVSYGIRDQKLVVVILHTHLK